MQQAYPTHVVAYVEPLTSVQFLATINFLADIPASAPRPSSPRKKPIIATNSSVNSSQRRTTKALPCKTQQQLGGTDFFFSHVSTLDLCSFLNHLVQAKASRPIAFGVLIDNYGGIHHSMGLTKTRDRA
jgi:hypothetical protein